MSYINPTLYIVKETAKINLEFFTKGYYHKVKEITGNRMTNIIDILKERFERNTHRHKGIEWDQIESLFNTERLESLEYMEDTGGEPDVAEYEGNLYFFDFSKQSPMRRSICYDKEARVNRKKNAPETSAVEESEMHGLKLLTEDMYLYLQSIETVDEKTSSWVETPKEIRKLGGAIFGNYHYGRTFIYHNGADSYYGARGYRGYIKL